MQNPIFSRRQSSGFSLIEIMVSIVIGMLMVIVIMRFFIATEASKRVTTGGNNAQINGVISIYNLQRDIRSSGYGLSSYRVLGCGLTYTTTTDATSVSQVMAPVIVNPATTQVPAGDPNTDTLLVFSTNSNGSSEGDVLTAASTVSGSGGTYQVMTPSTFNVGDYVVGQVLARAATCALTLDRIKTKSGSTLTTKIGTSGFLINDLLFNLGSSLSIQAYAVRNGNLTVCDYMAYNCGKSSYASPIDSNVWVPISSNVVSLRAEYGRDTSNIGTSSMSGILDTYDQITPGSAADSSGLLPYCSWARVVGLRIAAVTRSAEYDKTKPTSAAPTWAGSTVTTSTPVNAIALPIVLSNDSSWQYYRYKTLQTVIPMRTMIWSGSQATYQGGSAGC